jgi:hypothetical protein
MIHGEHNTVGPHSGSYPAAVPLPVILSNTLIHKHATQGASSRTPWGGVKGEWRKDSD